jgi:hypothetical protein
MMPRVEDVGMDYYIAVLIEAVEMTVVEQSYRRSIEVTRLGDPRRLAGSK